VGTSCSHDLNEAPLVDELLPEEYLGRGLETVGRLDRDTSGLLVMTTDGGLIHRLTHPKRKVGKRYQVTYQGELARDAVARCAEGFCLGGEEPGDDVPTLPAQLTLNAKGQATLVLQEGRYHQVRRMFGVLGAEVTALHRDRIGQLDLPADLLPGMIRPATADELARLEQP
jgi:16S rRNA pseudouridine516 synthase